MLFGCVHFLGFILTSTYTVQFSSSVYVRYKKQILHRTVPFHSFCTVPKINLTPYNSTPLFLYGKKSKSCTVRFLSTLSVRCKRQISHHTACSYFLCTVPSAFFTPYNSLISLSVQCFLYFCNNLF